MNIFRRIARSRRGAVALEMAFAGPPFLLLVVTILDLGLMLASQSILEGSARDAARLIRTGQVQAATSPITTFQNTLCNEMSSMISTATCQSQVIFSVQTFSDFGSVSMTPCNQNANATGSGTPCSFTPGAASQIVAVQATYNRPFIIPWVGACLSGGNCWTGIGTTPGTATGTGQVPLVSTVIFKNEPF